jgi:hypothetical protein
MSLIGLGTLALLGWARRRKAATRVDMLRRPEGMPGRYVARVKIA